MTLKKRHPFAKRKLFTLFCSSFALIFLLTNCETSIEEEAVEPSPISVEESAPNPTDTPVPPSAEEEAPAILTPPPLPASTGEGDADVLFVSAQLTGDNVWRFSVTVEHNDTGWEDYADGWDVVLPDGTVLLPNANDPFTRLLLHPHENEQPFTRNQSNIEIPADITSVTVRAHDIVDGFGGQEVVVDLTAVSGENFEVDR